MAPWVLPALFTAGSVAANAIGRGQQSRAAADALRMERERQGRLDAEAQAVNTAARGRYDDMQGQTEAKASDLAGLYGEVAQEVPTRPIAAAPPTTSNVTVAAEGAERGRVAGNAADERGRLARLRAFEGVLGDIGVGQARDAGRIGQIGGFMRGSQNVLPMELNGAQTRGAGWMFLGDLANMGAGIATQRALIDPKSLAAMYGGTP